MSNQHTQQQWHVARCQLPAMEGGKQAGKGQGKRVGGQLALSHGAIVRSSGLSWELHTSVWFQKFTTGGAKEVFVTIFGHIIPDNRKPGISI